MARHRTGRPGMNPDLHQIEHGLLRELLRRFLVAELGCSHGGGIRQVGCGASAALDSLLAAHPVDRRGRCRLCRGRGWLGRRRRVCMVFRKAHYWLRQPPGQLLASEWWIDLLPPPSAADPQLTQVLSGIAADSSGDPTQPRPSRSRFLPEDSRRRDGRTQITVGSGANPRLSLAPL